MGPRLHADQFLVTVEERRGGLDRWDLAAFGAILLGLVVLHVPMRPGLYSDQGIYALMAEYPLKGLPPAPFRFRVATTLLAAWLPFGTSANFLVIGAAAMSATAMIIRRTAERIGGRARGLVAMVLFVGSGEVLLSIRTPYATEPLSMLAGATALELGRQRRWLAAGLAIAAGATARETTLFLLLPLGAWCLAAEVGGAVRMRALAALGAPGVAMYLLLHRTPLLYGVVPGEHVQTPAEILAWNLHEDGGIGRYLVMVVLGSLGLMWLYVPRTMRSNNRYLSCTVLLLIPLLLGTMIASDWARILGYAVIVMATAVPVVAPWRVLRLLVPAQLVVAVLTAIGMPWVALLVAGGFLAAVVSTGGLHDHPPGGLADGAEPSREGPDATDWMQTSHVPGV